MVLRASRNCSLPLLASLISKHPTAVSSRERISPPPGPGSGVILYHQSNRTRESWSAVAGKLAAAGINVLTVDSRTHGESSGKSENRGGGARKTLWPQDLDIVFEALVSQPGVDRNVVGIGGAGALGVDNSVETARRVAGRIQYPRQADAGQGIRKGKKLTTQQFMSSDSEIFLCIDRSRKVRLTGWLSLRRHSGPLRLSNMRRRIGPDP